MRSGVALLNTTSTRAAFTASITSELRSKRTGSNGTRSRRASSRPRSWPTPRSVPSASFSAELGPPRYSATRSRPLGARISRASAAADIGTAGTAAHAARRAARHALIHADVRVFHHLRDLAHLAADHLTELGRRGGGKLEA